MNYMFKEVERTETEYSTIIYSLYADRGRQFLIVLQELSFLKLSLRQLDLLILIEIQYFPLVFLQMHFKKQWME